MFCIQPTDSYSAIDILSRQHSAYDALSRLCNQQPVGMACQPHSASIQTVSNLPSQDLDNAHIIHIEVVWVRRHHVNAGLCYQRRKQVFIAYLLAAHTATQPQRNLREATVCTAVEHKDS